jgi:hypothetical protein
MAFLQEYLWGVRLFVWLYFLISIVCGMIAIAFWKREVIKETYYKIRFPEKVIKIFIHYPGSLYRVFWRLIPDRDDFSLDGKRYLYEDQKIMRENDFYVYNKDNQMVAKAQGKEYFLEDKLNIRRKESKYPEIHYIFNVPYPIDFENIDKGSIEFSAQDVQDFEENNLFEELLTLEGKKNLLIMVLVIVGLTFIVSLFNLAKTMGWLK